MFLVKFQNKVNQLKAIETLWELTNLEFKDQPLVSKVVPSGPNDGMPLTPSEENSDN
jgi:hypothetical protein